MCEPRHLRYSVTHTPPRTGDIFIIAPDSQNARKDFGVSQPIRLPPECHRYTYIGQYPHDFPVRHGKSLGKIAEGGSGFAIRTTELLVSVDVYRAYLCDFCGYIISDFYENVDNKSRIIIVHVKRVTASVIDNLFDHRANGSPFLVVIGISIL